MILLLAILMLLPQAATQDPVSDLHNQMVEEHRQWAVMRNARVMDPQRGPAVWDAKEIKQWQRVRKAWKDYEKAQNLEYGIK